MLTDRWTSRIDRWHGGNLCSFGISESIALAIAAAATEVGVGAATAGTIGALGAGALEGAAGGALLGGITGGDPGKGALFGGLTGGAGGAFGGAVGDALGVGSTIGTGLVEGGVGAAYNAATGANPLTGALSGGASGLLSGALGSVGGSGTPAAPEGVVGAAPGGGAPGASAGAAPSSVPFSSPDITFSGDAGLSVPSAIGAGGGVPALVGTGGGAFSTPNFGSDPFTSGGPFPGAGAAGGAPAGGGGSLSEFVSGGTGGSSGGATPGPAAAPTPNSITTAFNDPTFGNITKALGNNANVLLPAAVLGGEALLQPKLPSETGTLNTLNASAQQLAGQGQALQSYLQTGTLPPGLQQSLSQASESAKATIRSQYAAHGMSGSSSEQADLANVDRQITSQGANLAFTLLQQGVQETQLSDALYQSILQQTVAQDNSLMQALGGFAAAAAGGGQTIRLQAAA